MAFRLLRSSLLSAWPGISGAFPLCSRKGYKLTAPVWEQTVDKNVLARSHPSVQSGRAHGGGPGLC